jgi:dTDP-4-dehydrorhamnose reductase
MKRALVLGGTGMLGGAVAVHWRRCGTAVLALSRAQADLTDRARLLEWAARFRPEVVVNCAAFTQVDDCETEVERAMEVNGAAVANAVAAAERVGAGFVQVSSDYVFDGRGYGQPGPGAGPTDGPRPYPEDAPTGPLSVYGRSKLAGEDEALRLPRALVVRTSWLFGPGGSNFVTTMLRLAGRGDPVEVVDDQVGCPTYTPFLARAIWDLIGAGARGVVHYCNRDAVSWYGFAREILGPGADLARIRTEELPRPAPRPAFSALGVGRFEATVGRRVESWIQGLGEYLETVSC